MPLARFFQLRGPEEEFGGGCGVVEGGAGLRVGEQAGVEDPADHHADAAFGGERQELGQASLVEQAVAAGQQHGVDVRLTDEPGRQLGLVHADADRAEHALGTQAFQLGVGLGEGPFGVVVRVVQVGDVDPVHAQALETALQ